MDYNGDSGGAGLSLPTAPGANEDTALARPAPRASAGLRWFAVATVFVLYAVVVLGFLDTATNSALGCGRSFPLCDGRFLPAPTFTSVIEWTHRVVSAFAGVLVLALVAWAWIEAGTSRHVRLLGLIGLGFLVIESAVGAAAVLAPEPDALVALHLGIALTSFGATAALMVALWRPPSASGARTLPRTMRRYLWAIVLFTYAVVYLGALVAQMRAGTACGGWPLCQGALVPTHFTWPVTVDFAHRLAALAALFVFWAQTRLLRGVRNTHPNLYRAAHLAFGLVLLTALSGGYLALTHIALTPTLIHVGLITLLFGAEAYLCAFATPDGAAAPSGGAA